MPKAMNARALARQNDVIVNRARVQAASDGSAIDAAVDEKVADAVTGDLTTENPFLAEKLNEFSHRLDALET